MNEPWNFIGLFDLFALSSDSEQFPISLVEAMAAACPAVATNVGDVVDMVAPENRPLLVPASDESAFSVALQTLANATNGRAKLGSAPTTKDRSCIAEDDITVAYAHPTSEPLGRSAALIFILG